ncbi:hypothetical protein, partial [Bacillus pacificus]|uniref:hypothetical protein n=1 Tax=Bacillus pacificus TaxID=2026187 RepID=UPI002090F236
LRAAIESTCLSSITISLFSVSGILPHPYQLKYFIKAQNKKNHNLTKLAKLWFISYCKLKNNLAM